MSNYNWNLYREQFPTRYWEHGTFDDKILKHLAHHHSVTPINSILDVGCGVFGTVSIKDFCSKNNIQVDMLDPYVDNKPSWMRESISWESIENHSYDALVFRGSINYLTIQQLKQCKNSLNKNGILIANTFLNPPSNEWRERIVSNCKDEPGIEKSRLFDGKVQHQIMFKDYFVEHEFFYYSKSVYTNLFDNTYFENYGSSTLLIFKKINI